MPDELHTVPQVDIDRDKIKRAVKEALDDKRMDDLSHQVLSCLHKWPRLFLTHTRQDTANGKLMRHETRLDLLESQQARLGNQTSFWQRNQDKLVWGVIVVGLMLFYFLLKNAGFPDFLN